MAYFIFENRKLFYREEGSGPLLLLLPGNTASSACLQGELSWFGRNYRAVALDFPGTGQSERQAAWPEDWWRLGAQAAAALVEYLDCGKALVLGVSGGGVVALEMALGFPARVKAVVAEAVREGGGLSRFLRKLVGRMD